MQIARFKSQNLHGYMNLNIFFNRDITFLTGANGSGKSSALYCAIALLNCDLQFLNDTDFESIEVQITQGRSKTNIRAERSERHIILKFGGESQFSFPKYIEDRTQPGFRLREAKSEYFSELLQLNAENPAIKGIIDVPSPLFLGIDRRTRTQNVSGVVQSGPSRKNIYKSAERNRSG